MNFIIYIFKMLLSSSRCFLAANAFFAMFDLVCSLSCFECTLSQEGCDNPTQNNISIVDCDRSVFTIVLDPDNKQARMRGIEGDDDFRCLTTIEKRGTDRFYTRRCALKSERSLCEMSSRDNYNLEFEKCSMCSKDFCNSSFVHKCDFIYLLLAVIVVLKINYL
ncbi:unnamed protein product [Psylliodes chrysocephalus]|uniref:Protein sleepless n=1 Tax=Psylliodes chrysocephalus TaxID=3402493 RepID=A0A9P0DE14_9CUCU|nr:unnamed protein product [Psylliodes chrysocephala]